MAPLTGFAALGLGLIGPASGCASPDCTLVGWHEGLTVAVQGLDASADETHEFRIEADGIDVALAIEFEDAVGNCLPDAPAETMCDDSVSAGRYGSLRASLEWVRPTSLTLNVHYVDGGELAGGPEVARIRVLRAGETVGDGTFEPDYQRDEPNGEGCGVATRAEAELTLSPGRTALERSR